MLGTGSAQPWQLVQQRLKSRRSGVKPVSAMLTPPETSRRAAR
jgi:hypothetical protein